MMLPLKDEEPSPALCKLLNTFDHPFKIIWLEHLFYVRLSTGNWSYKEEKGIASALEGVHSLIGTKNTYNKNPHTILGYEDEIGHSIQSGLVCVVDICYFCLLIIILPSGNNIQHFLWRSPPPPLSIHMVKVGDIPSLHSETRDPGLTNQSTVSLAVHWQ
jgi:hypothetical protein